MHGSRNCSWMLSSSHPTTTVSHSVGRLRWASGLYVLLPVHRHQACMLWKILSPSQLWKFLPKTVKGPLLFWNHGASRTSVLLLGFLLDLSRKDSLFLICAGAGYKAQVGPEISPQRDALSTCTSSCQDSNALRREVTGFGKGLQPFICCHDTFWSLTAENGTCDTLTGTQQRSCSKALI